MTSSLARRILCREVIVNARKDTKRAPRYLRARRMTLLTTTRFSENSGMLRILPAFL
jgi:hypothetical protein